MNSFYYLDHGPHEIFFYEIETEVSYEELCAFIEKKAFQYCEENDIDTQMYLNGEIEDEIVLELKIKDKDYNFNLYSALDDVSSVLKKKPFKYRKIKIPTEEMI